MKIKMGKDVVGVLALAYKANRPVMLVGPHGIGKSEIIAQAAKELGIKHLVRDLSLMEPPDLVGLPFQKGGRTIYAPPAFLPSTGGGFLVLEELNRSERYMRSPCLQLLTARCLNEYKLPNGWLPMAAINPEGEDYDVDSLDPAMLSRFLRLEVEADVPSWLTWAGPAGIDKSVCRYVSKTRNIFEKTNPRAWSYVSDLVIASKGMDMAGRKTLLVAIAGVVGDIHAKAFMRQFTSTDAPITVEAILGKYDGVRPMVAEWVRARKTDQLESIAHEVQLALQVSDQCAEIRGSKEMMRNLKDFIQDLPADLGKEVRSKAKEEGALP